MKTYTLAQVKDKYLGQVGTPKRDKYEADLQAYLVGEALKKARTAKKLTQEQLGAKVGVEKAQISRLENGKNIRVSTLVRVFQAMGISLEIRLDKGKLGTIPLC